jgi:murein DD-endopeptidase MepM/ murein hydrolase activator NlpD
MEKLDNAHIPLYMPVKGKIKSGFGWRKSPFGYGRDFHTGIDIEAASGDIIRATAPGTVIDSSWNGGYGFTVRIAHKYNLVTIYAHCSSLFAKKGQTVKRDDIIAYVGQTGNAEVSHCHYEIRKKSIPIDSGPYATFRIGTKYRCSFLHYAVAEGSLSIVKKLVEKGAIINKKDEFYLTPIELAVMYRRKSIEEFLKSALLPEKK